MTAIIDAQDLLSLKSGGAISSFDLLASLLTGGGAAGQPEFRFSHKDSRAENAIAAAATAGMPISLHEYQGTPIPHGAIPPTTWANPDNTSFGGLLQSNAGGGRAKWVKSIVAGSNNAGYLIVYDRLGHCSGLSGTTTGAQNVNGGSPGTITRWTGGKGNFIFAEIYSALGSTQRSLTVAYTDGASIAQTSVAAGVGGTGVNVPSAQRMYQCSLVAGGNTVTSVTSATLSASTGTAGNFGIVIGHILTAVPISTLYSGWQSDFMNSPLVQIVPNMCVEMIFVPVGAAPSIDFGMTSVEA